MVVSLQCFDALVPSAVQLPQLDGQVDAAAGEEVASLTQREGRHCILMALQ